MAKKFDIIDELVTANRILAHEGIVDSFGHISVRHPKHKDRYLLSRARAPERIEPSDIMEFTLEGDPLDPKKAKTTHAPYTERYIHGAIYETRPEIMSVVHNHSPSTIPFGITNTKLKPLLHMCASIGHDVPLWDSHDKFGDTALLVNNMAMGRDLAKKLGKGRTALMRGHGAVIAGTSIRHAVFISNYLELNSKLQMQAMNMGKIQFLHPGEVDAVIARTSHYTLNRAWENWAMRAGRKMQASD